jgi:hypothetical protein
MAATNDSPSGTGHQAEHAGAVASSVVRRVRIRCAVLGWATLALWLSVAASFLAYVQVFFTYFYPQFRRHVDVAAESAELPRGHIEGLAAVMKALATVTVSWAYVWAGLVVLAAACTLLYVSATRRATLRQIQAGLAQISEQLRELPANRTPPPRT